MSIRLAVLAAALLCGACAERPNDTQAYIKAVQNSPSYRQGYSDGCEMAGLSVDHADAHRNNDAFNNDPNYRLGWVAGQDKCKPVTFTKPGQKSPY